MSVELKITYDGVEPGLSEHRLSIGSFGEPLRLLLAALRRTASGILNQALDNPEYGRKGGKFADVARLIDLELRSIEHGCAAPTFVCTAPIPTGQLSLAAPGFAPQDLMEASVKRLLDDIENESSGRPRNATVRRYLDAIPKGVTRQEYVATRDGEPFAHAAFTEARLVMLPEQLPRLILIAGNVIAVGFEPGATFVTLKTKLGSLQCFATPKQVDTAVKLRTALVTAAVLDNKKPTLIWLREADREVPPPTVEETSRYAHADWGQTLETLAK